MWIIMWIDIEYKKIYNDSKKKGIRLRFYNGVDAEVNQFCKDFCKWLRTLYWFPIRCNIYIFNYTKIKCSDGTKCEAVFRHYDDDENSNVSELPTIWVAAGSYKKEVKRRDKRVVLFNYLASIVHELTHYFQWYFKEFDDGKRTKRSLEYMATRWKNYLLSEYWVKLYGVDENGLLK